MILSLDDGTDDEDTDTEDDAIDVHYKLRFRQRLFTTTYERSRVEGDVTPHSTYSRGYLSVEWMQPAKTASTYNFILHS
jgi:hypothetical protein